MSAQAPIINSSGLEVSGVSKLFSGVAALTDVSIAVRPGEIVGLSGHKCARQSTIHNGI